MNGSREFGLTTSLFDSLPRTITFWKIGFDSGHSQQEVKCFDIPTDFDPSEPFVLFPTLCLLVYVAEDTVCI